MNAIHNAFSVRYQEALSCLLTQIIQKFQFRYNQSHLDGLDDESLDDDVSLYMVNGNHLLVYLQ